MGDRWSAPRPGRFNPARYPLYRRPQRRCGYVRKISPLQGFDPQTMHPTASRYSVYSILGQLRYMKYEINLHFMSRLISYLPQNSVLTLERPIDNFCTGKQWLFILRITWNMWIYLDVWQHAVLSMIKRNKTSQKQFFINNLSITPITRFDWDRHLQSI
jgi:hypothetical protein